MKSLIKAISNLMADNVHFRDLIVGGGATLIVKLLAGGSAFFLSIFLARQLGAAESGLFFLGLALVTFSSAMGRIGLDNSIIRFVSIIRASNDYSKYKSLYLKSISSAGILSTIIVIFYYSAGGFFTKFVISQPGFHSVFFVMTLAVPLVSLYTIHAQALLGLKKSVKAMMVLNVIVPSSTLAFSYLFLLDSAKQVAIVYVVTCGLALVIGYVWLARSIPRLNESANFPSSTLKSSCLPLWGVTLLSQCVQWSSLLMLGAWDTSNNVAIFSAAQRTALLTSLILVAVNAIAGPKFAALYSQGDFVGLRRIAVWSVRLMVGSAFPILLILLVAPGWVMSFFGAEFKNGSTILSILAIGQFVNIASGSVGFLLSMTGHEHELRVNSIIGATLSISLGLWLIPLYGIVGGAISTAAAVSAQNLMGVYQVHKLLGFNTLAIWRKP